MRSVAPDPGSGEKYRCEHCSTLDALVEASAVAALVVETDPASAPGAVRLDERLGSVFDLVRLLHQLHDGQAEP